LSGVAPLLVIVIYPAPAVAPFGVALAHGCEI